MRIGSSIGRVGGPGAAATGAPAAPPAAGRGAKRFIEVMREGVRPPTPGPTPSGRPSAPAPAGIGKPRSGTIAVGGQGASPIAGLLKSTLDSERKLDGILAAAGRGKTFSPQELIAMQAEVFRYSQTVEMVSRTANRVVGAVKQTLGTQV